MWKRCAGSVRSCMKFPFDSVRKRMSSVHQMPQGTRMMVKGALEQVLPRCDRLLVEGRTLRLRGEDRQRIQQACAQLAKAAKRILAFADRREDGSFAEEQLVFLGFIAFIDPLREGVAESVETARRAGIDVVMITGDHPMTALAIARELQIAQGEDEVLSGAQLDALDETSLRRQIRKVRVFARVTPSHKVRIVDAFKQSGAIVAMSGDGVNDAPSLKRADIGIAMGKNGSDVCRQASDMILTDDRFETIVDAVSEGRHLYMNIQKAVLYLLSCNLGEIMALFLAIALLPSMPAPLAAVQILWVNLVTDAFPALALGVDPKEQDVMSKKPRPEKRRTVRTWNGAVYRSQWHVYRYGDAGGLSLWTAAGHCACADDGVHGPLDDTAVSFAQPSFAEPFALPQSSDGESLVAADVCVRNRPADPRLYAPAGPAAAAYGFARFHQLAGRCGALRQRHRDQ